MTARVLVCLTAHHGPDRTLSSLESAHRLGARDAAVDVLLLDDDPADAAPLAARCAEVGVGYYRSRRTLGPARAANLGLRAALEGEYDHVLLVEAGCLLPANLLDSLLPAATQPGVACVMPWSNDVGLYSLENTAPARHLADQETVDWLAAALGSNFGDVVFDVPVATGGCVLIPTAAVRDVGLLDPVFTYGFGQLEDWSLRSKSFGHRVCLAPSTFVYRPAPDSAPSAARAAAVADHRGRALVDLRFPQFQDQLVAFRSSGLVEAARTGAARSVMVEGARTAGYTVDVGWLPRTVHDDSTRVRCVVAPDEAGVVRCEFRGFVFERPIGGVEELAAALDDLFGTLPAQVNVYDRGRVGSELALRLGLAADRFVYPTRV